MSARTSWAGPARRVICLVLLGLILSACGGPFASAPPTPPRLADKITFYDWLEDMPQSVLEAFTKEYGVQVNYVTYEATEEAIDKMRAGSVYDVVVMDNRFIPSLVKDGLLAKLEVTHLPNLKNIAANFRDLMYDPGNQYSVPYNWGAMGLVFRSDLTPRPPTRWTDLWDPIYGGKVGLWNTMPREMMGVALKSLGYSVNSEKPAELDAAVQQLLALKSAAVVVETVNVVTVAPLLESGQVVIAVGWAEDAIKGREANPAIGYVYPQEGTLLWGDNFVIPANSPARYTAEVFLNFILRPEISAQIANENYYATPNEAAWKLIKPELLNDPVVFPPEEVMKQAEIILPLSPEGQRQFDTAWARFMPEGK